MIRLSRKKLSLAILAAMYSSFPRAQVVTDGSMGDAITINGPNYVINQSLGTLAGNNLFHSFLQFNVLQNESAVFRGDSDINNVISRVTGGDPSLIQGFIKSEVGNADFYFINPAGVIFGDGAKVDVPAAFHVSTAQRLTFANGDVFSSTTSENSTLSVAAPDSFGFLGQQTADIRFDNTDIKINTGSIASFSAANVQFEQSRLKMDSGALQLNAVGAIDASLTIEQPALTGDGLVSFNNSEIKIEG